MTVADSNRVPCPHCAELILPAARVCRFCGGELRAAHDGSALVGGEQKSKGEGWIWGIVAVAVSIGVVAFTAKPSPQTKAPPPRAETTRTMERDTTARYLGNELTITSGRSHRDCKIIINDHFSATDRMIEAGATTFNLSDFSSSAGERFNVLRFKVNQLYISCRSPSDDSVFLTFR